MSKEYTFDDWLASRIQNKNHLTKLILQNILNNDPNQNGDFISDAEYSKIKEAQKKAFHWAVQIVSNTEIKHYQQKYAELVTDQPAEAEKWLQNHISSIEKFISDHPELENRYIEKQVEASFIDGSDYQRKKEIYQRMIAEGSNFLGAITPVRNRDNEKSWLFEMYVKKKCLEALLELKADDKENPRLKYHSENYWDTAQQIYNDGYIWEEVYKIMTKEMNSLGIEIRHSSFDSFDTVRKKHQREQRSSK